MSSAQKIQSVDVEHGEEEYAVFPCNQQQWCRVEEEIEKLLSHSVPNVAVVLDNLHHIAQGREGTDQRVLTIFRGLSQFLTKIDDDERRKFHQIILPTILRRARQLPQLLANYTGMPLLLRQKAGSVDVSRQLVASIIACGFLCLFPTLSSKYKDSFHTMNFTNFFCHLSNLPQQAKLRCILHYFERLSETPDGPCGNITITRKVLREVDTPDLDWWQKSDVKLCPLHVHESGLIEDTQQPCIQEEIRFATCPELIMTMLVIEAMEDNEAVWVQGFETYSAYTGYAKTLRFAGDFRDDNPVDSQGNKLTTLCAIDALQRASRRQYEDVNILREVNKAFIGFLQKTSENANIHNAKGVEHYAQQLSEDILSHAIGQASMVLTHSRLQEHAVPPMYGERLNNKERCDSPDTSSDSHHATSFPTGENERSWMMMGTRRRSSNLSEIGSRRSSDLMSRRSSSSTRYSSDLSSDLEELYESFPPIDPRQRPAAIKEEVAHGGPIVLQEFVSSMVSDMVDECSSLAMQMMPGVQNFDETQPVDVAKPKPFKPPVSQTSNLPSDISWEFSLEHDSSSDSSNQTDDQKAKENIVRFVSQLVEKAFVGAECATGPVLEDECSGGTDYLHLHHSWSSSDSGSPLHYHTDNISPRQSTHQHVPHVAQSHLHHAGYERARRLSHPLDGHPRFTPPVDMVSSRPNLRSAELQRISQDSRDWSCLVDENLRAPRISQFDGSPRSEATAMWRHQEALLLHEVAQMSGRRRSSADFLGSPPSTDNSRQQLHADSGMLRDGAHGGRSSLYANFADPLQHRNSWASVNHGESLTDDLKEAVANSASAFQSVQVTTENSSHAKDQRGYPHAAEATDYSVDSRLTTFDSHTRSNSNLRPDTSWLSVQRSHSHEPDRQPDSSMSTFRYGGTNTAAVAGQIVQSTLETAVRTATQGQAAGGISQWRNTQRREHDRSGSSVSQQSGRSVNFSRSLSVSRPHHKGSMDESLSTFANSLARHASLGELNTHHLQQRRGSSTFRDTVLSDFADQLRDSNRTAADPAWLDLQPHSTGFGHNRLFRRSSGDSRCSSISRHSSTDILFPSCSTPDELPPWGVNHGRRSSREVVLDLLSNRSMCSVHQQLKRHSTQISHLDWFVQDLLMEAFNDAFIQLFGQDYLESIDYQRRQKRKPPGSRSRRSSCSEDRQLGKFVDMFVDKIIHQAVEIYKEESKLKTRHKRAPSEEEEDGSNYEDALDFPYRELEKFASSLASTIMDKARHDVARVQQLGPYSVATGNWGCGAFRGNPQLKCLLQWAAASAAGAPALHYYTFSSTELERLTEVMDCVRCRGWNVGHILQYVVQYSHQYGSTDSGSLPGVFDMLLAYAS